MMMTKSTKIFVSLCCIIATHSAFAQAKYSAIKIDKNFKDTFSFVKHWDYPAGVYQDDSTVEFYTLYDSIVHASDTVHLFFTANCWTDVQGGYEIRYCFAEKYKDRIVLTFSDGLPAYASEYYITIIGDSFCFRPRTIYPARYAGEKIVYGVTKQELRLNKPSYAPGESIIGYVNTEFVETVSVPGKGTQSRTFHLKGFIKTPLHLPSKD